MSWTHLQLLQGIDTHLTANLTGASSYKEITAISPSTSAGDFRNFNPGKFPLLGLAIPIVDYSDQAIQAVSPKVDVTFTCAFRQTGSRPEAEGVEFYTATQNLQAYLISQQESTTNPFGLSYVAGMHLVSLNTLPSFIGEVDQNRKGFAVARFTVELFMDTP